MATEITESNCRKCSRATRHEVLFQVKHASEFSWFNEEHTWQVLRCLGCETVGFRHRFDDFDNVTELPNGTSKHAIKYTRYPSTIPGHRELSALHVVPELIRKIYRQSITAFAGDAKVLAGIGLRGTIEAVCTHLKVSGSSLEKRIDALAKAGYISSSDKRRLHAIRFLGNDAAHEVREAPVSDLRVALEIVEHLINSVFILEYKAKNLHVQVDTFEHFLELVEHRCGEIVGTAPLSLAAILGDHKRRVAADLTEYELNLIAAIHAGQVKYLKLDAVETVEGKQVQLYVIDRTQLDDDIPF